MLIKAKGLIFETVDYEEIGIVKMDLEGYSLEMSVPISKLEYYENLEDTEVDVEFEVDDIVYDPVSEEEEDKSNILIIGKSV